MSVVGLGPPCQAAPHPVTVPRRPDTESPGEGRQMGRMYLGTRSVSTENDDREGNCVCGTWRR